MTAALRALVRDITGGIRAAFDSPDAWVAAALTAALVAVAVVTAVRA